MDPKIWKLERFPIAFFKNRGCQPRAHQSKKNPPRAKQRIYWFFEMVEDCWSKLSVSIQLKNCSAMRKPNEHTKFLFKNANWTLKFKSWIFQLHWGYLQMKPEILIFWNPVFGAWLWTTWAPLLPSKLNLAALTRSIWTIKFRNPTRPPQIIKPSSKSKSIGSMDHHSLTWLLTHRQIHLCYSILYSPLSTFTFLFGSRSPCRFSQSHGSKTQNRLRKFRSAKLQFQQFGTKIIQSFQHCTFAPCKFSQTHRPRK